jgi:protein-L-isoaspartate(D-aspartate) O-methyltransferase
VGDKLMGPNPMLDLLRKALPLLLLTACDRGDGTARPRVAFGGASSVDSSTPTPTEPFVEDKQTRREREELVRAIETRERISAKVAAALREVPRHAFVPQDQWHRAYEDTPLSIGYGQTISQPTVVAMMTEALDLQGNEVVLEVGTGFGYQAAVLANLVRRVETIEIIEPLAKNASNALRRLGIQNVHVHVGDGYAGLPSLAPFDRIILTAAPPEVPRALLDQLRKGGKIVLPVGPRFGVQDLLVIEKGPDGRLEQRNLGAVRFVPMVRHDE